MRLLTKANPFLSTRIECEFHCCEIRDRPFRRKCIYEAVFRGLLPMKLLPMKLSSVYVEMDVFISQLSCSLVQNERWGISQAWRYPI